MNDHWLNDVAPVLTAVVAALSAIAVAWLQCRKGTTMSEEPKPLLNAVQLARALGVSQSTVSTMAREGRIPFVRLTEHSRRYDLAEVLAALKTSG